MLASKRLGSPASLTAVAASKERSSGARMRATLPAAKMAHDVRHGGNLRRRLPLLLRGVDRRRALGRRYGRDPRAARSGARRPHPRRALWSWAHLPAAGGG